MRDGPSELMHLRAWRPALVHALPISALVLCLIYYWFAIADRYSVFLYYHDMGPLVPDTSPFSFVTASRYWMAGLVAGGAVAALYAALNWLLGRTVAGYRPPVWWRVWAPSALLLVIGVPAITMTVNQPALPASNAAQTTIATLIGLALALIPGYLAAEPPGALVWLAADGWGLMLVMLSLPNLEHATRWLAAGRAWWVWLSVASIAAGVGWLLVMTGLYVWRRRSIPDAAAVFVAGLSVAYLLMPLLHHVSFTDGYFYISNSDNFFGRNVPLQMVAWLIAAGLVLGMTRLRTNLATRRGGPTVGE